MGRDAPAGSSGHSWPVHLAPADCVRRETAKGLLVTEPPAWFRWMKSGCLFLGSCLFWLIDTVPSSILVRHPCPPSSEAQRSPGPHHV